MREKLFLLTLIFIFVISTGFSQNSTRVKRKPVKSQSVVAEAEKNWKQFFADFQQTTKNRDTKALLKVMANDFYYSCAYQGGDYEQKGKNFQIKKFDTSDSENICGCWETLDKIALANTAKVSRILKKGEVIAGVDYIKTYARIVSDYWSKEDESPCNERNNWALFEYRSGAWYFVKLSFCEGE